MRFKFRIAALGSITLACALPGVGFGANLSSFRSAAASAGSIDLNQWELVLPVDSSGQLSGDAAVVRPAAITPPWLVHQGKNDLLFWAPAGGATTGHSFHSRTELDSLSGFPAGHAGHTMKATAMVEELPNVSRTIVIGQIHGAGAFSAAPFVLLEIRGDRLEVSVESKPKLKGSRGPSDGEVTSEHRLLRGVGINRTFSFVIRTTKNAIRITTEFGSLSAPQGSPASVTVPVPGDWNGDKVHFSAGDYEQDNASTSKTGGGKVLFSAISEN
jgi:Alginate lyase